MSVLSIKKDNFQSVVLESNKPVLVDFFANWCGPCRMLLPIVDEFAKENPHIKVGKVNVDEESELAKQFRVMTIPTVLVFKDGKEVKRSVGVISEEELEELLEV